MYALNVLTTLNTSRVALPHLAAHFAVPASGEFVRTLRSLATGPTTLDLYEADRLEKL